MRQLTRKKTQFLKTMDKMIALVMSVGLSPKNNVRAGGRDQVEKRRLRHGLKDECEF